MLEDYSSWTVIVIISWSYTCTLLRITLVGSVLVIVSWAVGNNLVYFRVTLVYDYDGILGCCK